MSEQNSQQNNDFVGSFYSNNQQEQNNNTNNYFNETTTNNNYYQNPMYDSINVNGSYTAQYNEVEQKAKVQNVLAKTFAFMFAVLIITAFSAYETANSDLFYTVFSSKLWIVLVAAEIITVFAAQSAMKKNNVMMSGILLLVYSVINGMTLSTIFYVYDLGSIVMIFMLAAVVFGALAVFGLVTKKDLGTLGSVGIMLLIGVIALSLMNLFIKSSSLSTALAAVGLAVFIGLTAYDIQKIKKLATTQSEESTTVLAMFGALMIYLDLVNIFLYLLRLFGKRN